MKRITKALLRVQELVVKHELDRDVQAYGGIALLSFGGYLAYRPLGFILAGASLLYLALFHSHVLSRLAGGRRS